MKFEEDLMVEIIQLALAEDKARQDITTWALLEYDRLVSARVIAKANGIISGIDVFTRTFQILDDTVSFQVQRGDGEPVEAGQTVLDIRGKESSILKGERTALNFLQRLSGIASLTRKFVDKLKPYPCVLLDTRKTTPGMRYLEKKAVRDGGGTNHRLNLEDMAMVKDNHIRMAGSITRAFQEVKKKFPGKKIEVEVKDLDELREALALPVDMIMLDNFQADGIREALVLKGAGPNPAVKFEISGNVTLENIEERAQPGIDFISVGALTHSFQSLDISLDIIDKKEGSYEGIL